MNSQLQCVLHAQGLCVKIETPSHDHDAMMARRDIQDLEDFLLLAHTGELSSEQQGMACAVPRVHRSLRAQGPRIQTDGNVTASKVSAVKDGD